MNSLSNAFGGIKGESPAEKKENFKRGLSSQLAMANAQALIQSSTEKCYSKCITNPGTSLSSKDEKCLESCLNQYLQAFNIVSQTYVQTVGEMRNTGATLGGPL